MRLPATLSGLRAELPDEAACAAYLERLRWGRRGFVCPWCFRKGPPYRFKARPEVLRCKSCMRDVRVTEGTAMEGSKLPLWTWIGAAYLIACGVNIIYWADLHLGTRRPQALERIAAALWEYDPGRGPANVRFRAMLRPRP
jgi:hypothetical protein